MRGGRILIVEDDWTTAGTVKLYLEREGFEVELAADGAAALGAARARPADLIVLDWLLPGVNGIDFCRRIRLESDVPIIMLTARTTEPDKLQGLDAGADDYVTKPFSPRELAARVRAVLRRSTASANGRTFCFGGLEVNTERNQVRINGTPVPVTPTEFRLLETLCRRPGRAFSRTELVERALGNEYEGTERTVDMHVANLRRKLDQPGCPAAIQTVFGVGYRFEPDGHVS